MIFVQKGHILLGVFSGEIIFGGASFGGASVIGRNFVFQNFRAFLRESLLSEGFLSEFWGLIFGRAFFPLFFFLGGSAYQTFTVI